MSAFSAWFAIAALLLASTSSAGADQPAEIRARLHDVATALTDRNPAGAMTPFSKSLPEYERLRRYFDGLTEAFSIVNEVDVLDEQDTETATVARIRWALTLSNPQTDLSTHRSAEIDVRFAREKGKWKIVAFAPIDLFDPAQALQPSQ